MVRIERTKNDELGRGASVFREFKSVLEKRECEWK